MSGGMGGGCNSNFTCYTINIKYLKYAFYSNIILQVATLQHAIASVYWARHGAMSTLDSLQSIFITISIYITYCAHTHLLCTQPSLRKHPFLVICSWCRDLRNLFQFYIVDDELKNHFLSFFYSIILSGYISCINQALTIKYHAFSIFTKLIPESNLQLFSVSLCILRTVQI